ncbi:serine/threonine protein kinase [bacterium]|nr:serine/threonine protein kinase [bacterium]
MNASIIPRKRESTRASQPSSPAGFAGLDHDTQRESTRRLGGLALIYSIGYFLANGISVATDRAGTTTPELVATTLSILFGLSTFAICRFGHLPARWFPTFAIGFEVLAVLGIVSAGWGWEHAEARSMQGFAEVLGFTGDGFLTDFVGVLEANGINPLGEGHLSWVGIVIVLFPMIVPLPPGRILLGSFLAATASALLMVLSPAVNGVPQAVAPFLPSLMIGTIVPVYICAILATLASRTVYRMARDLSKERRMGSYQLVEKIGEGGIGEVWKAKHRLLARPAAIKLIRPGMLGSNDETISETAKKRFEREAQATAELQSPHTIELYDFGITDEDTFYYVMEFLNGFDLRSLVEKHGPLPPARVIHLLGQACHSLEDAHSVGFVHRDIKPANIFVCRRGPDFDFVKVLDFGMVKRSTEVHDGDAQLTTEGLTAGTPAYMAPEAVDRSGTVDERTDIYGLGCVAYWLLTGQLVFEGETPMAMLIQHVKDEAPPPSTRTEIEIPAVLDRVVLDCLAKNPGRRPQTVRELKARLDECALATGTWDRELAERWWTIHAPGDAPARGVA